MKTTFPPYHQKPTTLAQHTHSLKNPPPSQIHHTTQKDSTAPSKKGDHVPPIILRDSKLWNNLSLYLKENNIKFVKAKSTNEGIKIYPSTVDDYRKTVKHLDLKKHPYYTFQLPNDKHLHIVIRGVPTSYNTDEVKKSYRTRAFILKPHSG